jgi:hypothetical protein
MLFFEGRFPGGLVFGYAEINFIPYFAVLVPPLKKRNPEVHAERNVLARALWQAIEKGREGIAKLRNAHDVVGVENHNFACQRHLSLLLLERKLHPV